MSKPIIKAENNENVPVLEVNTPTGNVPVLPIESSGGVEPVLESITITENGTHIPPVGVDGYNEIIVNVLPSGEGVANALIVNAVPTPVEPEVLPEGMLYIVPNGTQVCPPIPDGYSYNVICINKFDPGQWSDRPSTQDVLNASKFWLYQDNTEVPKTRRDSTTIITWGGSATTSTEPTKILEYDTSGAFEWVDITSDPDTVGDFVNNLISHDIRDCIYSNVVINRFTVGNPEYNPESNKVTTQCKITDIYYINDFDCYVVTDGVAVFEHTYSMYQIISNYIGGN